MSSFLVADTEKQSHLCEGREGVRGNTGILPLIINLSSRRKLVIGFTLHPLYPRKASLEPNEQDAGRAPDSVWSLWEREISVVPAENRGSIPGQEHCTKLCYHGSYGKLP
jgi:hypothetical protein